MVGLLITCWSSEWLQINQTKKSNIAMENGPFEDVFPVRNGDIPASYVRLPECN